MVALQKNSGFTLIELIVTVVVLAIVAAVAFPSFTQTIRESEASTEANTMVSALQLARSEAVRRSEVVSVSGLSGSFANGWCVHTTAACTDGTGGTSDTRIKVFDAPSADVSSAVSRIAFSGRGERSIPAPSGGNTVVSVEPAGCASGEDDRRRVVTVGVSGRADVTRGDCL